MYNCTYLEVLYLSRSKSERIELRVTPDEKKQLYELATMAGMSVAAYLLGNSIGDRVGDSILKMTRKGR